MKVFTDIISGDELLSDSYDVNTIFEGAVYEVDSKLVQVGGESFDIGCGNEFGGGGEDEGVDDSVAKVINLVNAFQYTETPYSKKDYQLSIKNYMKEIKTRLDESNPEASAEFVRGAQQAIKDILSRFDDFQFFTGSSMNPDAMLIPAYYKEGAEAPTFYACLYVCFL
eukprot:GILI01000393.1.p1 GENE.GILI01000393.1~~GILI01000393.1.p1  ORF type:complete len:178 (-),score=69.84 GILI01000393.1:66-569(-)